MIDPGSLKWLDAEQRLELIYSDVLPAQFSFL